MTATYEAIATTTLGSAQSSVTFSSISSSFTDLVIIVNTGGTLATAAIQMRFNGDTNTNYSTTAIWGDGSSATSARYSNRNSMLVGNLPAGLPTTLTTNNLIHIFNYANTTTNKTALSRFNNAAAEATAAVHLWRNTNAITEVAILTPASTFLANSTFTLYGIKAE